jgi:hypothetical protein
MEDLMLEDEAKDLVKPSSEGAWESWHRRRVIPHYVLPGTHQRRYRRSELVQWIESGRRK